MENLKSSDTSASPSDASLDHDSTQNEKKKGEPSSKNLLDAEWAKYEKLAKSISSVALFSALADETFNAYIEDTPTDDVDDYFPPAGIHSVAGSRIFKQPSLVERKQFDPCEDLLKTAYNNCEDPSSENCSCSDESDVEDLSAADELIFTREKSPVEVKLEILSNWGDPRSLGLKRVEFFDAFGEEYLFDELQDTIEARINNPKVSLLLCITFE